MLLVLPNAILSQFQKGSGPPLPVMHRMRSCSDASQAIDRRLTTDGGDKGDRHLIDMLIIF